MADTQTNHPHLSGVLTPVRSEDDFELEVVGRIPDALAGAYYRNGPNPQFDPQGPYFDFLGDGMIHGFFLEPNKDGGSAHVGRARYHNHWDSVTSQRIFSPSSQAFIEWRKNLGSISSPVSTAILSPPRLSAATGYEKALPDSGRAREMLCREG